MKRKLKLIPSVFLLLLLTGMTLFTAYYLYDKNNTAPDDSEASSKFPLTEIPISSVKTNNIGQWTLSKNDTYVAGSDWGNLDERKVYHTRLTHSEDTNNSWELRIGNGSQIYSIRTSQGELIGAQNAKGEWIDRVLQTVLVSGDKATENYPYFIHQAGTYARDNLTFPFFSPIIYESFNKNSSTYSTVVWPQQAHIPTIHTSKIIAEQHIKDLGDGVVEITYVYHNFGKDTINFINTPWVGLKKSNNPHYILSKPNGQYYEMQGDTSWSLTKNIYQNSETGGWFAISETTAANSKGLGFVTGEGKYNSESFTRTSTVTRFGSANGEDLSVFETSTKAFIKPDESFFFRYYMISNTLSKIQQYGNQLSNSVEYGTLDFEENSVTKIPICKKTISGVTRYIRDCAGLTPVFYTYERPVNGSKPIFVLKDNSNNIIYSDNPNEISNKSYDGKTEYLEYLGWAIPYPNANTNCYDYKKLSDTIGGNYKGTLNLMVRVNNSNSCKGQKCTDGTDYSQCSSTEPKFCQNGTLVNKCSTCGCPDGKTCQSDGSCRTSTQQCSDNTLYGKCSGTKPLYCQNGVTVNNCTYCGCPDNQTCQADGSCSDTTTTKVTCGALDTNGDNKLTIIDFAAFTKVYNKQCKDTAPTTGCKGKDVNSDKKINIVDFANFTKKYNKASCI